MSKRPIHKHLVIISNGPSAAIYRETDVMTLGNERLIIAAVNKAAAQQHCDWWVLYDFQTFVNVKPLSMNPRIWTSRYADEKLRSMQPDQIRQWESYHQVYQDSVEIPWPGDGRDLPNRWNAYSGLAALGLAIYLQAKRVTIYGADMAGVSDCTGTDREGSRDRIRWQRERRSWNILVDHLTYQGISIRRICPGRIEEIPDGSTERPPQP